MTRTLPEAISSSACRREWVSVKTLFSRMPSAGVDLFGGADRDIDRDDQDFDCRDGFDENEGCLLKAASNLGRGSALADGTLTKKPLDGDEEKRRRMKMRGGRNIRNT